MSREGKLAKNTVILSIGTFLPKIASIVTLPILTAYLSKEEYGTFDLISVLVSLLLPAVTLQIQTAAFRFLIFEREHETEVKKIISTIFAFITPMSLAALVVLWFFLPGSLTSVKLSICAYFFIDIIVASTRQIARGLDRTLDYSISSLVSACGKMLFIAILVGKLKMGLFGATISLFIASFLSWVILVIRLRLFHYIRFSYVSRDMLKRMLNYSWPMVPNSMSMWVMRLSDRLVILSVMGVTWNAVYAVANKIPQLLHLAQTSFTMAWQENASIVSKDKDASAYYSAMFKTMFNLMAGFLGLLVCMTPLLFVIFVKGSYDDAYPQMPILFMAQFCYAMATFLGGIYVAYMKTKSVGITTAAAAASNLIIDLALIKWIGLYAASGSTLVSYLFLLIYRMIDVQKIVKVKYDYKNIIFVSIILVVECVLCFMRNTTMNIINIALGVICFVSLNRSFIKVLWKKTLEILKKVKAKTLKKIHKN